MGAAHTAMALNSSTLPQHSSEIPSKLLGLRMTKQRREVYGVLLDQPDHPTAQDVFLRAKERMPSISLATVYNCLEALTSHGLIRAVNFDRSPSRYCSNLNEHFHFQDATTEKIHDIFLKDGVALADLLALPQGTDISEVELNLKGKILDNS